MKLFAPILAFAWALLAPVLAHAVNVKSLDMGKNVQVWYVEDHTLPMISLTASLPAGSAYDPRDKPGLASFTAALLNEGAGNYKAYEYQSRLSDRAIRLSFSTQRDYLTISLVTLTENAPEAFRLLGLALTRPRFDADAIARVRAQILSAIQQEKEDPGTVAAKGFFNSYFHDHPYAHSVNGTPESIGRIGRADIKRFADSHWVRNGLKIAVAGDTNAATLKTLIASAFEKLPSRWAPPVPAPKRVGAPGVHVIPMPVPQPTAVFAVPGLLRNDKDFIPAYVANYILGGGGFSSRLMNEVREKRGLTYGITTALDALRKAGIVVGQLATKAGGMRETISVIRATMSDFAANGATEKELADAKRFLTGSFPLAFASNTGISGQLAVFQRSGLAIDYVQKRNGLINAVTLDDVKRVAKRLFSQNKLTIVIGGSLEGPGAAAKPLPGAGRPPVPAPPPPKPAPPKTTAPGPKPPIASGTAAKPKEQPKAPASPPSGAAPGHH